MIRIIDRYIFFSLWKPFLAGFFGTMIIVTFGNTLRAIRLFSEGKAAKSAIVYWYLYRIPEDVQFVFPVSVLLATLLVFGQMSKQSEITALRAAGVNPTRLSVPVAVFGLISCFTLFVVLDQIVPRSMRESERIWKDEIRFTRTAHPFKERFLMKGKGDTLVYVGRYDLKTNDMREVMIREYRPQDHAPVRQITAPSATFVAGNVWTLRDATIHLFHQNPPLLVSNKTMEIELGEGPDDFAREERPPVEMTSAELLTEIKRLEERGLANTQALKVELYLKSSFPFCVLIFCLIGSVMGFTSNRTGGAIGFGISLLVTFLYYISMSLSSSLGKTGVLHPMIAAWTHNFIFLGVALTLLFRNQRQ